MSIFFEIDLIFFFFFSSFSVFHTYPLLKVVPPSVWTALHSWYGGAPAILREVVELQNNELQLEIYPLCLRAALCDAQGRVQPNEREIVISKTATVAELQTRICRMFRL